MTKKDYIQIAAVLNANQSPLSTVLDFADMLGEDNERFDRQRFVKASTIELEKYLGHEVNYLKREAGA